jgi:hypothetical protein
MANTIASIVIGKILHENRRELNAQSMGCKESSEAYASGLLAKTRHDTVKWIFADGSSISITTVKGDKTTAYQRRHPVWILRGAGVEE